MAPSGPTNTDPKQLLRLAQAGDNHSLGELLELYRRYLKRLARLQISRRLQAKIDPSDLVQGTFLRAHQKLAQFQGTTEELVCCLRQILVTSIAHWARRRHGMRCSGAPGMEQELAAKL